MQSMLASPENHRVSFEGRTPTIQYASWLFRKTEGTDITNIVVCSKLMIFGLWVLLKGK